MVCSNVCVFLSLGLFLFFGTKGSDTHIKVLGKGSFIYKNLLASITIMNIVFSDVKVEVEKLVFSFEFVNNANYDKEYDVLSNLCLIIEGDNNDLRLVHERLKELKTPIQGLFDVKGKELPELRFVVSEVLECQLTLKQVSTILSQSLIKCISGITLACDNQQSFGLLGATKGGPDMDEKTEVKSEVKSDGREDSETPRVQPYVKGNVAVVVGMELVYQCLLGLSNGLKLQDLSKRIRFTSKLLKSVQINNDLIVEKIPTYVKRYQMIKSASINEQDIKEDIKDDVAVYWLDCADHTRTCILFHISDRWMAIVLFTAKARFKKYSSLQAFNYETLGEIPLETDAVSCKKFTAGKFPENAGLLDATGKQNLILVYNEVNNVLNDENPDSMWGETDEDEDDQPIF